MKTILRRGAVQIFLATAILVFFCYPGKSQEVEQAARKIVVKTQAIYPTLAHTMNIHGMVKLEVVVEPNGTVKSIEVKGGHPLLTQSAVTAVGHWKFEPAAKQSKEVVEISFVAE